MADLFYRVTAGADEASARNLLTSNSLLVELVCGQHSDLLQSDPQVASLRRCKKDDQASLLDMPGVRLFRG
jgi:hypothetical protein